MCELQSDPVDGQKHAANHPSRAFVAITEPVACGQDVDVSGSQVRRILDRLSLAMTWTETAQLHESDAVLMRVAAKFAGLPHTRTKRDHGQLRREHDVGTSHKAG